MKITIVPNPVLIKELRGHLRGPRAYLFLTGTLVLLGGVSYGFYRLALFSAQASFGSVLPGAVIGQSTFIGLMFLALVVICVLAPSLTAGAISGEYERKTMDLLLATPLSPFSILFGKLAAALSYIVLVLVASIPLVSLAFVFGGVTLSDLLGALVVLFLFAVAFCMIALFLSALFRRSAAALIVSYVLLGLFVFGTVFVYAVTAVIQERQPPNWILALNPFSAFSSALVQLSAPGLYDRPSPLNSGSSPSGLVSLLWVASGGSIDSRFPLTTPLWYYTTGIYGWLTVVLFLLSAQLLKPVRRMRVRTWAAIGVFCLASIAAPPIIYGTFAPERLLSESDVPPTPTPVFLQPRMAPPPVPPRKVIVPVATLTPVPTWPPENESASPIATTVIIRTATPAPTATPGN